MDFARSGMLGVTVLCIALAGALFGGYLAGVDTIEEPAVDYEYLADVSGLFDYDRSPNYIDFDSSTNYTGYFSRTTGEYFPENRVSFTEYDGVNNYRINNAPVETISMVLTLPDDSPSDEIRQMRIFAADQYSWTDDAESIRLSDIISMVTFQRSGTFKISSQQGIDSYPGSGSGTERILDWVVIANIDDFASNGNYHAATREFIDSSSTPSKYNMLSLSCIADLGLGIASLYYDNDFKSKVMDIAIDQCVVIYGGQPSPVHTEHWLQLSYDSDCRFELNAAPEYLDPTRGVTLRGD